ncbi:8501_t:CDS:2, partial [Racocetra persica]
GRDDVEKIQISLLPQHVKLTIKFGGGVGKYCRIEGNMNKSLYCKIIKNEFMANGV